MGDRGQYTIIFCHPTIARCQITILSSYDCIALSYVATLVIQSLTIVPETFFMSPILQNLIWNDRTLLELNTFGPEQFFRLFPPRPLGSWHTHFLSMSFFLLHKLRWPWQISRALSLFFLSIKYKFYSAFYAGLKNSRKILRNFYIALRVQKKKQGPVSLSEMYSRVKVEIA